MTTEETRSSGSEMVALSRAAIRGSLLASSKPAPLIRTGTSDTVSDTPTEVPAPLAKIRDSRQARVLHVDDDPEIGDLVQTFLERVSDDLSVVTTSSVVEALNHLEEHRVDCIVSDYQMPTTDGLEFLEIVRDQYPDLPFILYTGHGSEEVASEAIAAGVTDYMQKGTGTEQYEVLANRVENAIEQYRTEQQFWKALSWYQRLIEQELAGVCIVQDGTFVYVNQKLADMFGYTQDELIDSSPSLVATQSDEERVRDALHEQNCDSDSFQFEFAARRRDGETITVEISAGSIEYDGAQALIGVVRDDPGG